MANEALTGGKLEKVLAALDANWQAEMEGHQTYQALAERDSDPVRAQVLHHLAGAEWEHAALWAGRIRELAGPEPIYKGSEHGDADSLANRAGGIQMALRRLEIDESRDIAKYGEQLNKREIPRLCRGGSKTLRVPGVCFPVLRSNSLFWWRSWQ